MNMNTWVLLLLVVAQAVYTASLFNVAALVWALAYKLVALADPTAFTFNAAELHPQTLTARLMYFSVMTLTTVGYGDITALNPFARSLAAAVHGGAATARAREAVRA